MLLAWVVGKYIFPLPFLLHSKEQISDETLSIRALEVEKHSILCHVDIFCGVGI